MADRRAAFARSRAVPRVEMPAEDVGRMLHRGVLTSTWRLLAFLGLLDSPAAQVALLLAYRLNAQSDESTVTLARAGETLVAILDRLTDQTPAETRALSDLDVVLAEIDRVAQQLMS